MVLLFRTWQQTLEHAWNGNTIQQLYVASIKHLAVVQ